jgi:RHS repeat-associated protein
LPFPGGFNPDEQAFKYNGKEFDTMHGLNWYDIHARMYDPVIMRTPTLDPLSESYYSWSPYSWCGNNPIKIIDPTGMYWYTNGRSNTMWSSTYLGETYTDDNGLEWTSRGTGFTFLSGNKVSIYGEDTDKNGSTIPTMSAFTFFGSFERILLPLLYLHFQFGRGNDFLIDAKSLDFSKTSKEELGLLGMNENDRQTANLFKTGINVYSLAFGKLNMIYLGNDKFSIVTEKFDFDPRGDSSFSRNVATFFGGLLFGRIFNYPASLQPNTFFGGPFDTYFIGTVTIK